MKGNGYEGVILAGEQHTTFGVKEYWTPTKGDVAALEAKLTPYLKEALKKDPMTKRDGGKEVLKDLSKYKRQYVGIIKGGRKLIYVNMFCDAFDTDWKREYLHVMDGGTCYIELEYDVDLKKFVKLYVHGEA